MESLLENPSDAQATSKTPPSGEESELLPGLQGVKHIVAVASCKGGVGKSTVAVNLAYSLARQNFRVGIFDADVYGPSLPTLVKMEDSTIYANKANGMALPPVHHGVKCMSYGFLRGAEEREDRSPAAILRGPIVSTLVQSLVTSTDWGELDYLVLDLPPGTGDIQLTLAQKLEIDGAVVVTTPQKLSYVDVVKGIEMFDKLKVPTIAVVENMSYFTCGSCDTPHRLFGPGFQNRIKSQYGVKNSFEIPLSPLMAESADAGTPFFLDNSQQSAYLREIYSQIGVGVIEEIKVVKTTRGRSSVTFDSSAQQIVFTEHDRSIRLSPRDVRIHCRCALCVHEITGEKLLKEETIPGSVVPKSVDARGNYAVEIQWSDGHGSLYPYDSLKQIPY